MCPFVFPEADDLPNIDHARGLTELHHAAWYGDSIKTQILLQLGTNVNTTTTSGGSTPLHYAARKDQPDIARQLVDAGANVSSG
ncbi:Palmitoyltransferase AKR1 [Metarhizium anisopliae]|nr:Palmitoyltransferase AKR1 [Metarhizium anisopliae]